MKIPPIYVLDQHGHNGQILRARVLNEDDLKRETEFLRVNGYTMRTEQERPQGPGRGEYVVYNLMRTP